MYNKTKPHLKGAGGPFINHFLNGEPVLQETYEYATYDWASRAKYVLRQNQDTPKFVYLAFNAPHEKVEVGKNIVCVFFFSIF